MEDSMAAPPATAAESEGTTTDEDVHLSPSSVCRGGDGGGRVKILCSFGGRIMPRPSDGALKYVGGETRVLALPRSIPFFDMKKKLKEMFKTEVAAIKYQLLAEDLDVLVSVTCDEDLVHMLDEFDRLEAKRSPSASPRFRVYVFAPQPACLPSAGGATVSSSSSRAGSYARHYHPQHHPQHHHFQPPERYVATVPATPNGSPPYPPPPHGAVSAGNSPRANAVGSEQAVFRAGMQRVRSTPNLGSLDAAPQQFHQLAAAEGGGGMAGYMGSSPGHAGAGHLYLQGNCHPYYHQLHQYSPAPLPVPVSHHAGRYVRSGSYLAPAGMPSLRSGRPVSRAGPPFSEMHTPKKATTIWD